MSVPLDKAGLPGVAAVVAPLDAATLATWADTFPDSAGKINQAALMLVRQQLLRIDGLTMKGADGIEVPFETKSEVHLRSLPIAAIRTTYEALLSRTIVSAEQETKLNLPFDSAEAPAGATTIPATAPTAAQKTGV
jgi:hypothetical protein